MMYTFRDYDDVSLWITAGPSRRLRKLYKELAVLVAEMDAVKASNPVPEHAPSSYQIKRRQLVPLDAKYWELLNRIDRLQNDREEWVWQSIALDKRDRSVTD